MALGTRLGSTAHSQLLGRLPPRRSRIALRARSPPLPFLARTAAAPAGPGAQAEGGSLGRDLAAEFKARDDYDLTAKDIAGIIAQLDTLGVRRLKVPPCEGRKEGGG